MSKQLSISTLSAILLIFAAGALANTPQYSVTDIGTLGGTSTWAAAINDYGQVVGESATGSQGHAFLYGHGKMYDLGAPGGIGSTATGINNAGEIVGCISITSGQDNAFLYSGGQMQNLAYSGLSEAYGINDAGYVVGGSYGQALLYHDGFTSTLLGICANAINNTGQIVGQFLAYNGTVHAFLDRGADMCDLGSLSPFGGSQAFGINASGQIVGDSITFSGSDHAFLFSDGLMHDIGTLGGLTSEAWGINASGQVVGQSYPKSGAGNHAFLYTSGQMRDLNDLIAASLRYTLNVATGINDKGQIVCNGINSLGQQHGFLLTPLSSGDFTADGKVDDADYTAWADYFGKTPTDYQVGSDPNGGYNDADYTNWADNFGHTWSDVPEPLTVSLLALGGIALLKRQRGQGR